MLINCFFIFFFSFQNNGIGAGLSHCGLIFYEFKSYFSLINGVVVMIQYDYKSDFILTVNIRAWLFPEY